MGSHELVLNVRINPAQMSFYSVSFDAINRALGANNAVSMPVSLVQDNQEIKVQTGQFLRSLEDVQQLVVAVHNDSQARPPQCSSVILPISASRPMSPSMAPGIRTVTAPKQKLKASSRQ